MKNKIDWEELSHLGRTKLLILRIRNWIFYNFSITKRGYTASTVISLICMSLFVLNPYPKIKINDFVYKGNNTENRCKVNLRDENLNVLKESFQPDGLIRISHKCNKLEFLSFSIHDEQNSIVGYSLNNPSYKNKEVLVDKEFFISGQSILNINISYGKVTNIEDHLKKSKTFLHYVSAGK